MNLENFSRVSFILNLYITPKQNRKSALGSFAPKRDEDPQNALSAYHGHFPRKSAIIKGSLAERDGQLKASYASWALYIKTERDGQLKVVCRKRRAT